MKKGNISDAIIRFQDAINSDSSFLQPYIELAEIFLAQNKSRSAEELLLRYTRSRSGRYLFLLGRSQSQQKKWNEAIENFQKASESGIVDEAIFLEWAKVYQQMENSKKTIEVLRKGAGNPSYSKIESLLQSLESQTIKPFEDQFFDELKSVQQVTRGKFAIATVIKLKLTGGAGEAIAFKDVGDSTEYLPYYREAVSSSLLEKLPDDKFYPDYVMTRRNMIFYLAKYLKAKNEGWNSYSDLSDRDPIYKDAQKMTAWQIIKPKADKSIGLQDNISGTELLEVLQNIVTARKE